MDAAKRAKSAGFDIIYVYAGMSFGPFQFISRRTDRRNDEYGAHSRTACACCAK